MASVHPKSRPTLPFATSLDEISPAKNTGPWPIHGQSIPAVSPKILLKWTPMITPQAKQQQKIEQQP
jgi:hypothetical protein